MWLWTALWSSEHWLCLFLQQLQVFLCLLYWPLRSVRAQSQEKGGNSVALTTGVIGASSPVSRMSWGP